MIETFSQYNDRMAILEGLEKFQDIELSESDEKEINEAVDRFIELYEKDELENIDEGIFGSILGGLTGAALGKTVGKIIARVLGVEKGVLYDLLTSRLVGAAIGSAVGKRIL